MKTLHLLTIFFLLPQLLVSQDLLITGDFDRVPFEVFVQEVEAETGIAIIYKTEWMTGIFITAKGDSLDLLRVLEENFSGKDLFVHIHYNSTVFITRGIPLVVALPDYNKGGDVLQTESDDHGKIDLTESEKSYIEGRKKIGVSTLVIGNPRGEPDGKPAIINGIILDETTGESLIGATIYIEELSKGYVTDNNGHFILSLPPGNFTARFNCMGMEEMNFFLDVKSSGDLNINMTSKLYPIDEITVTSGVYDNVKGMEMGFARLSMKNIKEIPVVMGERDVLKVLEMMPGVQNTGEGTSGIYVRGGSADQNLFIFDRIPVYNPSHLFGFFSAFNPDIIRDFSHYKSNLPANYGGRLSSVIDISTRQGSNKSFTAHGGISPITAHVAVEGPIRRDRHSFIMSARTTYSDWILNRIRNPDFHHSNANFYDLAGGVNLRLNEKNLFKTSAYYSSDRISLASQNTHKYSNAGASVNWWHQHTSKLNSDISLLFSQYKFSEENYSVPPEAYKHEYRINHFENKVDFNWIAAEKHKVTFGGNLIFYDLDRGDVNSLGPESRRSPIRLGTEQGLEGALYVSDHYQVYERLTLNAGLRYSFFDYIGPKTVYLYQPGIPKSQESITDSLVFDKGESVAFYSGPEWRTSLNFMTGVNSSVKVSYNKTRQYMFTLSNTISVSPVDQWKLSDYHIKPAAADQISLGYYHNVPGMNVNLSGEVYYKKVKNTVDYRDGASFILSPDIETEVLQGIQEAYGIEFLLKKYAGKYNGWLSFTYSRSFLKMDGLNPSEKINMGRWYPANYDIPVSLNAWVLYRVNRRISLSGNLVYHTGRPITYPISQFRIKERSYVSYSDRNIYRIPDYFRLDLSINLEGNLKAEKLGHSFWMLNIYNLTGRDSAYSVFFKFEDDELNAYKISIFSQPIFTLSWNFKFGNYAND